MDAIVVDGVCKRFRRYSARTHFTLREAFVNVARLRRQRGNEYYFEALKGVTFSVPEGMTFGVVGRNGSGKSSLLKMLAGIYRPDAGRLQVTGKVAALLNLGVGFHPELTGRENVRINALALGLTPRQVKDKFDEIISFAEIEEFIDAPVRTYSTGMYIRLAFSIAVNVDPDVLLLDEVLAVGDADFARKCYARMDEFKQRGKTIVLVTHDLHTVEQWCDRAMWINEGEVRAIGDPREVLNQYQPKMIEEMLVEQPV